MQAGIIQNVEGLKRTRKQRNGKFAVSLEREHPSSLALGHGALGNQAFGLRQIYIMFPSPPPILRLWGLDWDLDQWLPWFSSFWIQPKLYYWLFWFSSL